MTEDQMVATVAVELCSACGKVTALVDMQLLASPEEYILGLCPVCDEMYGEI